MKNNSIDKHLLAEKILAAHQKEGLAPHIRFLISIHALVSLGEKSLLNLVTDMALNNGVTIEHIREILLQTHLFCGFPRTINGFAVLHRCLSQRDGRASQPVKALREKRPSRAWRKRGEGLFKVIYQKNHSDVLASLKSFHPDLAEWILNDAYGKVLSREGLEAKNRELAAIGTLTVLKVFPQLLSHIKGGLHLGANREEVKEAIRQMELYTSRETVIRGLRLLATGTCNVEPYQE